MTRRRLTVLGIVAVVGVGMWWWSSSQTLKPKKNQASSKVSETKRKYSPGRLASRSSRISGIVVTQTGEAIAGATVSLALPNFERGLSRTPGDAPQAAVTRSDSEGRWTFRTLTPGKYSLAATASGYRPARQGPVVIRAGDHQRNIEMVLAAGGYRLHGSVTDVGGGPIQGAFVRITPLGSESIFRVLDAPFTTSTNSEGQYTIDLAPGKFMAEAVHSEYAPQQQFAQIARAEQKLDFVLTPGARIGGRVLDRVSGEPVAGVFVSYRASSRRASATSLALDTLGLQGATTDASGKFVLGGLNPGSYYLQARGQGYASEQIPVVMSIAQTQGDVTVYVERAYSIRGRVVDAAEDARGIEGVLVAVYSLAPMMAQLGRQTTGADGSYAIHGLKPGVYTVGAGTEGFMLSLMGATVTIVDDDLDDVVVALRRGKTIRGRVEPPAVAKVSLGIAAAGISPFNFANPMSALTTQTTSNARGEFALPNVSGGKFTVVAVTEDGERGELPVEVADADIDDVLVAMTPQATITGAVVDSTGAPLVGATVRAARRMTTINYGDALNRAGTVTDAQGRFVLRGLKPAEYPLTVYNAGERLRIIGTSGELESDKRVVVRAASKVEVRLEVEPMDATIRGTVVNADGAAAIDAWVEARPTGRRWGHAHRVLTDDSGQFAVKGLPQREYDLLAEGDGGSGRVRLEKVRAGEHGVRLQLEALGRIDGTVTENGKPSRHFTMTLRGVTNRTRNVANPRGTFSLSRLPAGEHTLVVDSKNGNTQEVISLESGQTVTLELNLAAYGTLRGRVVDQIGEPVVGYMVVASSSDTSAVRQMTDMMRRGALVTDAAGAFTIRQLAAGNGTLMVIDSDRSSLGAGNGIVAWMTYTLEAGQDLELGDVVATISASDAVVAP